MVILIKQQFTTQHLTCSIHKHNTIKGMFAAPSLWIRYNIFLLFDQSFSHFLDHHHSKKFDRSPQNHKYFYRQCIDTHNTTFWRSSYAIFYLMWTINNLYILNINSYIFRLLYQIHLIIDFICNTNTKYFCQHN